LHLSKEELARHCRRHDSIIASLHGSTARHWNQHHFIIASVQGRTGTPLQATWSHYRISPLKYCTPLKPLGCSY
jgi:hypothetical protein